MEILSIWGEFLGGIGVLLSLIFLGVQTRAANRLALASSQREQRHIWQEMMFFIGEHTSEYREFLNNFDEMDPDRQTKAAMIFFAMGNQLDTLLKLNAEGLETDDNLRYVMDAFVGHVSTPGGYKFWQKMSEIDLYGDDVLNAVNGKLATMEVPNEDFMNHMQWLKFSPTNR
jgi:hypothetical protein